MDPALEGDPQSVGDSGVETAAKDLRKEAAAGVVAG
jgi:hypothetical protein